MLDALPIFTRYGRCRNLDEMLAMPLWEFWAFLRSVDRDDAIRSIAQVHIGRLAFGGMDEKASKKIVERWNSAIEPKPRAKKREKKQDPQAFFQEFGALMRRG